MISFSEYINYITKKFISNYLKYINDIKEDKTDGILEYEYHTLSNTKNIETVNYLNTKKYIKILSNRSLNHVFVLTLENETNDKIIDTLIEMDKITINLIKYIVLNSERIKEILTEYVNEFDKDVENGLEFINNQEYIEQKTERWHEVRHNMISASTCGYLDAKRCNCSIDKEEKQILEKSNLKPKTRFNGWSIPALKHGQQFEDVSGELYNLFNNIESKEYGILTDSDKSFIGASPDGVIISSTNDDLYSKLKLGRMREIKNPVSRLISENIPNYYYYQMQQQLYVCKLPYCDFIQTTIKYMDNCDNFNKFLNNNIETLKNIKSWSELKNTISNDILENINYYNLLNIYGDTLLNEDLKNINNIILNIIINHWDNVYPIPITNIASNGNIKGVLFSYVNYKDGGDVDFKIEWLPFNKAYDSIDDINTYIDMFNSKYNKYGFILEEIIYWTCEKYNVIEVEYNQNMYEKLVLPTLEKKWKLITDIRNKPSVEEGEKLYLKYYSKIDKKNKKTNSIVYKMDLS